MAAVTPTLLTLQEAAERRRRNVKAAEAPLNPAVARLVIALAEDREAEDYRRIQQGQGR